MSQKFEMRAPISWIMIVALTLLFFSFTPKQQTSSCQTAYWIGGLAPRSANCDARSLYKRLISPEQFFTEFHNWKGRPVYFIYGHTVGYMISGLAVPFVWLVGVQSEPDKTKIIKEVTSTFHWRTAFHILNIAVVFACCWIAIRITGAPSQSWIAIGLAFAVASLDIVEAGVYHWHTNIMNLLTALGSALFFLLGAQYYLLSFGAIILLGLSIGLGSLTYPSIIILLPSFYCGALASTLLNYKISSSQFLKKIPTFICLGVTSIAPLILWSNLNTYWFKTNTYLTLDYGQFQWLPEAIKNGNIVETITQKSTVFATIVAKNTALELLLAFFMAAFLVFVQFKQNEKNPEKFPLLPILACICAICAVLSFNFLQGYFASRMHYSFIALIYVLLAIWAVRINAKEAAAVAFGVIGIVQLTNAMLYHTVTGIF